MSTETITLAIFIIIGGIQILQLTYCYLIWRFLNKKFEYLNNKCISLLEDNEDLRILLEEIEKK